MKKLLILFCLGLLISSCSSDDNDGNVIENGSILGYWEFQYAEPVEVITKDTESTEKVKNFIRKNYKGTDWEFFKEGKALEYEDGKGGLYISEHKYSINGKNLTTVYTEGGYEGAPWTNQIEINGNTLTRYFDDAEELRMDFPSAGVTKAIVALKYTRKK